MIETRRLGFSLLAHAIEHQGTADTLSEVVLSGGNTLFVGKVPESLKASTFGEMTRALNMQMRGELILGSTNRKARKDHANPNDDFPIHSDLRVLYLAPESILGV